MAIPDEIDTARRHWVQLLFDPLATDAECTAARERLDSLRREHPARLSARADEKAADAAGYQSVSQPG